MTDGADSALNQTDQLRLAVGTDSPDWLALGMLKAEILHLDARDVEARKLFDEELDGHLDQLDPSIAVLPRR